MSPCASAAVGAFGPYIKVSMAEFVCLFNNYGRLSDARTGQGVGSASGAGDSLANCSGLVSNPRVVVVPRPVPALVSEKEKGTICPF
ncbi:hypothetical protein DSM101010T_26600 [Desulfovibrio subterraneus]|uniref:Uncharacterized protein n=1 Tax=Desulfovibrio subterraneus TaxID=2718620 RepID=A0A7J0BMB2_9BACT|nr:hypothetical protein DSM101010T_26600 [Desulfovibrio subterraneus]